MDSETDGWMQKCLNITAYITVRYCILEQTVWHKRSGTYLCYKVQFRRKASMLILQVRNER